MAVDKVLFENTAQIERLAELCEKNNAIERDLFVPEII